MAHHQGQRRLSIITSVALLLLLSILPTPPNAQSAAAPAATIQDAKRQADAATTIAANPGNSEIAKPVTTWLKRIDEIEKSLPKIADRDKALTSARIELGKISNDAAKYGSGLAPRLSEVKDLVAKLGPAPKDGEQSEAAQTASERLRLGAQLAAIDGAIKSSGVLQQRSSQIIDRIKELQRGIFTNQLLKKNANPLTPTYWRTIGTAQRQATGRIVLVLGQWWERAKATGLIWPFIAGLSVLWISVLFLTRGFITRSRNETSSHNPQFVQRASSAVSVTLLRALPTLITVAVAFLAFSSLGLLGPPAGKILYALGFGAIMITATHALTKTLLAPNRPVWRMLPFSDASARRLRWLTLAVACIYALNHVTTAFNQALFTPVALTINQSLIFSLIFIALLMAILLTHWGTVRDDSWLLDVDGDPRMSILWPTVIKLPLFAAAIIIFLAAISGYIALARFLSAQIINTSIILIFATLFHLAIDEFCLSMRSLDNAPARWLSRNLRMGAQSRAIMSSGTSIIAHLTLFAVAIGMVALQWGYSWTDLRDWAHTAFFGFQIGNVRISVASIIGGLGIFVAGVFLTGLAQRQLSQRVLSKPSFDAGVSNSIRTALGYAGYIVSGLIAIAVAGFNFTNLAIVAGALSVGIGFGLQSIVNNFVSGLILLVERPVKVGDWIIVGDKEGFVRKISVRSTEIQTFDKTSLIIPNSELITGRVENWTHDSTLGRILITIGVSYDDDPKTVYDLLLKIGKDHPETLDNPGPAVSFDDFGDSALVFSLRTYITDIRESLSVKTQLRMDIAREFRAAGISIPFPQRDVHIHTTSDKSSEAEHENLKKLHQKKRAPGSAA